MDKVRRLPFGPGVLIIVTLAIDIVATYWFSQTPGAADSLNYTVAIWTALLRAQVSVLIIWSVARLQADLWSWILPIGGIVAFSALRAHFGIWGGRWSTTDFIARSTMQTIFPMIALWLLIRTNLWPQLPARPVGQRFEFSVKQLLVWMTAVALFAGILIRFTMRHPEMGLITPIQAMLAPGALAIAVVLFAQSGFPSIVRWIAYLAAGALVAVAMASVQDWYGVERFIVEFMIEAAMIAIWVEWGEIVPHDKDIELRWA